MGKNARRAEGEWVRIADGKEGMRVEGKSM
jgi:hypothetical protein